MGYYNKNLVDKMQISQNRAAGVITGTRYDDKIRLSVDILLCSFSWGTNPYYRVFCNQIGKKLKWMYTIKKQGKWLFTIPSKILVFLLNRGYPQWGRWMSEKYNLYCMPEMSSIPFQKPFYFRNPGAGTIKFIMKILRDFPKIQFRYYNYGNHLTLGKWGGTKLHVYG